MQHGDSYTAQRHTTTGIPFETRNSLLFMSTWADEPLVMTHGHGTKMPERLLTCRPSAWQSPLTSIGDTPGGIHQRQRHKLELGQKCDHICKIIGKCCTTQPGMQHRKNTRLYGQLKDRLCMGCRLVLKLLKCPIAMSNRIKENTFARRNRRCPGQN